MAVKRVLNIIVVTSKHPIKKLLGLSLKPYWLTFSEKISLNCKSIKILIN